MDTQQFPQPGNDLPVIASALCEVDLAAAFNAAGSEESEAVVEGERFQRHGPPAAGVWDVRIDRFAGDEAACAFLRLPAGKAKRASIMLGGAFRVEGVPAGGWLLVPAVAAGPVYWIPVAPKLRRLDADGHILEERAPSLNGLDAGAERLRAEFEVEPAFVLDVVVWRFECNAAQFLNELRQLLTLETQPLFMWSSHTNYTRPADVYAHLVFGHVYENHTVWPRYWKVCSELDAWALYVALSALRLATGKRLYDLLRRQVTFSVIARQSADGAWRHGEWTDTMEAHYRLHAAAIHLLCAAFEDTKDPAITSALRKGVDFLTRQAVELSAGVWFPHDSLEADANSIKLLPFEWSRSTALGKPESSMLVLNTHLDTTIAVDRYAEVTGDKRYAELIESARATATALLGLKTADWLYRPLFWAIELTFLPTSQARALPLRLRAVKRLAWRYLIPRLHHIKSRFPRFVMPGGFIDRALSQAGCSVRYQPVNLMDLVRFRRRFGFGEQILADGIRFTRRSGLRLRWKEAKGKEDDSLGFWVDCLYGTCLLDGSLEFRAMLAEAVMDLEDAGLGLSPSLLGANNEAVPAGQANPCPSPADRRLRVINLSGTGRTELLVVNTADTSLQAGWDVAPDVELQWQGPDGNPIAPEAATNVPARSWIRAVAGDRPSGRM